MADGVQVKFGANIADLVEGINSATNELRQFAEAVGAMYLADKTAEFVAQFGEMGEKIERGAAMLGVSTTEVQQLGIASQLSGANQETLVKSVERLQVNLQHALVPTSQQAQALRALGLSAQQMLAVPIPEQVNLMADAFKRLVDQGINPTSLGMMLMGRGAMEMAPELEKGRAGLEEMRQRAEDAATVMTGQSVTALAEMKQSATLLEASLKSLGGTIMGQVAPSITEFDNQLAHSVGNITALVATGQFADFAMKALGSDMLLVADYAKLLAQAFTDLVLLNWGEFSKHWKENMDALEANANESLGQVDDVLEKARLQYKALLDQANETTKNLKPPPGFGGNQDALKAELEALQAQVAAQNAYYQSQVERINSLAKTFQITESQKTQMLLAAVNQREEFQAAELQQALGLQGLSQSQYQKYQDELTKIHQKATADRQKITNQAAQMEYAHWKAATDAISSAFNSQLRGLLAGTTTWSQAMKSIAGDLIIKMIEDALKYELEWLASQARVLAGHLATETGMTSATVAGTTARTTAEQTGASAGMLANVGAAIEAIMRDAAQAFAGVFAFLAPVMGPAAAGPAAAAQASVSAAAIFDVGTNYVVRGGLALIHPGETIIPAARGSGPYTGGGMGTQVHAPVSISVSALDSQSVARFFNDNSKHMLRALNDAVKRGAHLGLRAINP